MPVEKTASPKVSPSAPKDSPRNVRPSSRTRRALCRRAFTGLMACSGTPYLLLRLSGRPIKGFRFERRPYQRRPVPPASARRPDGPSSGRSGRSATSRHRPPARAGRSRSASASCVEERLGPRVALAGEERVQHLLEDRLRRSRDGEQGHRRPQLGVVRRAEDLPRRPVRVGEDGPGALDQAWPEQRVRGVRLGVLERPDRVVLGRRRGAEPGDLREDPPHPVAGLPPLPQLGDGMAVGALLGVAEPLQVAHASNVRVPRSQVPTTLPVTVRPCHGLLRLIEREASRSTTYDALGSTSVRFAGSPAVSARPWPVSPAMAAGLPDMTRATPAQSSSPPSTMTVATTGSAVSRPSMPKAASTKACSLSCRACGAWSVATASMVPSASAARSASTSSAGRSGGVTFYVGAEPPTRAVVSRRGGGGASAGTATPRLRAPPVTPAPPGVGAGAGG